MLRYKDNLCQCFGHHYRYGLVWDVKPGYAKVTFAEDNLPTDWLPVVVRKSLSDKEDWQLEINEQVVCIMDEDCDDGFIIGAICSKVDEPDAGEAAGKFRKLFSDGTLIEYDKNAHKLTVSVQGDISATAAGKVTVDAGSDLIAVSATEATVQAPTITLQGDVTVVGNLTAGSITTSGSSGSTGNMTIQGSLTATGDIKTGTVSLKNHIHPTPAGNSSPPIQ